MVNTTPKPRSSRRSVFQFDTHNSPSLKEQIRYNLLERDYGLRVHHRKTTRDQYNSAVEQVNVTSEHRYFHYRKRIIKNIAKDVSKTSTEI